MATPSVQPPAPDSQDLNTSPIKKDNNVFTANRKEVGDNLQHYEISPEDFSQLIGQEASDKDPAIPHVGDNDFVSYLNKLSKAVHEQDKGKCCLVCRGNLS
jgi:hypothetical protein